MTARTLVSLLLALLALLAPLPVTFGADAQLEDLLATAQAAFNSTEFERALELSLQAASKAEIALATADEQQARGLIDQQARAIDIGAQARMALGDRRGAGDAVEQLLRVRPGYRVDAAASGPAYAKLVEGRRQLLVGWIQPQCTPFPCDRVLVDGQPADFDPERGFAAIAGQREVALGRRNCRATAPESMKIPAGGTITPQATLEQTSRDVVVTTIPPGVTVRIDGEPVGRTGTAPEGQSLSLPLTIPSLAPGSYVLDFEAPCLRRIEQPVMVALDAQDPDAIVLDPVRLDATQATVVIDPPSSEGILTLDGRQVEAGAHETCPGEHEVSWTAGGRRVFMQSVDVASEEKITVRPLPRPTLALVAGSAEAMPRGLNGRFNIVTIPADAGSGLVSAVTRQVDGSSTPAPMHPSVQRQDAPGPAEMLRAAAPEADLLAVPLAGGDPARRLRRLALLDPERALLEWTAWPERDETSEKAIADRLAGRDLPLVVPFFGADLVRTRDAVVVASVFEKGPAAEAGVTPGMVVLAVDGADARTLDSPLERLPGAQPGKPVFLRVRSLGSEGGEQEIKIAPAAAIDAPNPKVFARGMLLPDVARLSVLKIAGTDEERAAGSVRAALLLAAAGRDEMAALALDRVTVDERLDPAGDAWGTVLFVQEAVARRLKREDLAASLRRQWETLKAARLGGRLGPPLAAATAD